MFKSESSRIDQKSNMADPIMHNDKEIMDFVHDIDFPNDNKLKYLNADKSEN
mgnify:CR=1 FL=1